MLALGREQWTMTLKILGKQKTFRSCSTNFGQTGEHKEPWEYAFELSGGSNFFSFENWYCKFKKSDDGVTGLVFFGSAYFSRVDTLLSNQ